MQEQKSQITHEMRCMWREVNMRRYDRLRDVSMPKPIPKPSDLKKKFEAAVCKKFPNVPKFDLIAQVDGAYTARSTQLTWEIVQEVFKDFK